MDEPTKKAAVVILLDEQGRVLVHNRQRKTTTSEKYGFLGGKVEKGEAIIDAAKREVFEETSYTPEDIRLLKVYAADEAGTHGFEVHVYTGVFPGFSAFKDSDEVLVSELELKTISDASKLELFPIAYQILTDLSERETEKRRLPS